MLVSLSPRATQQLLARSSGPVRGLLVKNGASSNNSVATRLFYSTCTRARPAVVPAVRQRRPMVRGEAVAFHVKDLEHMNSNSSLRKAHHSPAAALQVDYDYDEDDVFSSAQTNPQGVPKKEYESNIVCILDLDECLIHSQFLTNNPGAKFYAHQVARNTKDENGESLGRVDSFRFHLPDGDLVHVNKRPFLEEFLEEVTSKYETHIFTAAMKVYAEPILNHLDPNGDRFAQRWYRESCDLDKNMGAYVKNLGSLPLEKKKTASKKQGMTYDEYIDAQQQLQQQQSTASVKDTKDNHLRRVVLVDNNPLSFLANPTNGILVSSFYNDPADKTLPAVLDLLKELEPLEDVRPTLDARFGLKAALSEIQGNRRQQNGNATKAKSSLQWTSK